ncbi:MAG TPA: hypothetical protein VGO72_01985 [Herminiimonas sp.]|jgi:hypothetical protein|nr:hypothetical protein [Herminiimonas sp.]
MSADEWHYRWIKVLVHAGISVESAEHAFKLNHGPIENVNTEIDPVSNAQLFVDLHFA